MRVAKSDDIRGKAKVKTIDAGTAAVMLRALQLAQTQLDNYKQVNASWVAASRAGHAVPAKKPAARKPLHHNKHP